MSASGFLMVSGKMMCYRVNCCVGIHKTPQNGQGNGIKRKQDVALSAKGMKLFGVLEYYLDVNVQF